MWFLILKFLVDPNIRDQVNTWRGGGGKEPKSWNWFSDKVFPSHPTSLHSVTSIWMKSIYHMRLSIHQSKSETKLIDGKMLHQYSGPPYPYHLASYKPHIQLSTRIQLSFATFGSEFKVKVQAKTKTNLSTGHVAKFSRAKLWFKSIKIISWQDKPSQSVVIEMPKQPLILSAKLC